MYYSLILYTVGLKRILDYLANIHIREYLNTTLGIQIFVSNDIIVSSVYNMEMALQCLVMIIHKSQHLILFIIMPNA